MSIAWNNRTPWIVDLPKSRHQLEIERNVQLIQESRRRAQAAEEEAIANRTVPDPLPRGTALTPQQGAQGIARIRAGLSPYDDTPVDPETGTWAVNPTAAPSLATPVNFTKPQTNFARYAVVPSPPAAHMPPPAPAAQGFDQSAMAAGYQIPKAAFSAPLNATVDQLIAWMDANPGVMPPAESWKSLRFTVRTEADLQALGSEVQARGLEHGADSDEARRIIDYMNSKFPPSAWQRGKDAVFARGLLPALVASPVATAVIAGPSLGLAALELKKAYEGLQSQRRNDPRDGADKYWHAVGNFNAARMGPFGSKAAEWMSSGKERYDIYKGDAAYRIRNDETFNEYGRMMARLFPDGSAEDLLRPLLPPKAEKK